MLRPMESDMTPRFPATRVSATLVSPGVFLGVLLSLAAFPPSAALPANKGDTEKVTWLFSQNSGKSWCAYTDSAEYRRAVGIQQPAETARLVTFAGDVLELEYQITPASGDWVVMDKYSYTDGKLILRRTNLLLLEGLEIMQEATIGGAALRVVSAKTLDGENTTRAPKAYPDVPVRTTWKAFPFLDVARKREAVGTPELCEKVS